MNKNGAIIDGTYRVDETLGLGSFGTVFAVTETSTGKVYALKRLKSGLTQSIGRTQRFIRRLKTADRPPHESILPIIECSETSEGLPYWVMDYLQGQTLRQLISEKGALSNERFFEIAKAILEPLEKVHQAGETHRKINPDNVFLCDESHGGLSLKILDYGVVKDLVDQLAISPIRIASTSYLAPEFKNDLPSAWTPEVDVYAIGMVCFFMLTGRLPFKASDEGSGSPLDAPTFNVLMHMDKLPGPKRYRTEIPQPYDDVVCKALEFKRDKRYANAGEMLMDLEEAHARVASFEKASSLKATERRHFTPLPQQPAAPPPRYAMPVPEPETGNRSVRGRVSPSRPPSARRADEAERSDSVDPSEEMTLVDEGFNPSSSDAPSLDDIPDWSADQDDDDIEAGPTKISSMVEIFGNLPDFQPDAGQDESNESPSEEPEQIDTSSDDGSDQAQRYDVEISDERPKDIFDESSQEFFGDQEDDSSGEETLVEPSTEMLVNFSNELTPPPLNADDDDSDDDETKEWHGADALKAVANLEHAPQDTSDTQEHDVVPDPLSGDDDGAPSRQETASVSSIDAKTEDFIDDIQTTVRPEADPSQEDIDELKETKRFDRRRDMPPPGNLAPLPQAPEPTTILDPEGEPPSPPAPQPASPGRAYKPTMPLAPQDQRTPQKTMVLSPSQEAPKAPQKTLVISPPSQQPPANPVQPVPLEPPAQPPSPQNSPYPSSPRPTQPFPLDPPPRPPSSQPYPTRASSQPPAPQSGPMRPSPQPPTPQSGQIQSFQPPGAPTAATTSSPSFQDVAGPRDPSDGS